MTISANFTVNTVANPAAHLVASGGSVALALVTLTGVDSCVFSVQGVSGSYVSTPTLTPAGSPTGVTSSFVAATTTSGLGAAYLIRCRVSNAASGETVDAYGVVGVANAAGLLPLVFGEALTRDASIGWTGVLNQMAQVAADRIKLSAQTGTAYTAVLLDAGALVTMTNAAASAITVPPNSTTAFPVGTVITICQRGAGQVTITPGVGVTVNGYAGGTKLAGQYAYGTLIKISTDVWDLSGTIA